MSDIGTPRTCARCKQEVIFRSYLHKYCRPCAAICDVERKAKWSANRPKTHEPLSQEQIQARQERTETRRTMGLSKNEAAADSIIWGAEENPDLQRLVRVSVPFDQGLSKNSMWSMARGANYVFMGNKHKSIRAAIENSVRMAMSSDQPFVQGKVWIDILIQKPSHRGDAINMVDGICDAVKKAIAVDDNWFCIRKLDWQIVKTNPRIFIGIGQEVTSDHQPCSYCGHILPIDQFGKRKHGKTGRSRVCAPCSRIDDAARKVSRKRRKEKS